MKIAKSQLKRIIKEEMGEWDKGEPGYEQGMRRLRQLIREAHYFSSTNPSYEVHDRYGSAEGITEDHKKRFRIDLNIEDVLRGEGIGVREQLMQRADWRSMSSVKAFGRTEEEATAKMEKAIGKFLTKLNEKITDAQMSVASLTAYKDALEKM